MDAWAIRVLTGRHLHCGHLKHSFVFQCPGAVGRGLGAFGH